MAKRPIEITFLAKKIQKCLESMGTMKILTNIFITKMSENLVKKINFSSET